MCRVRLEAGKTEEAAFGQSEGAGSPAGARCKNEASKDAGVKDVKCNRDPQLGPSLRVLLHYWSDSSSEVRRGDSAKTFPSTSTGYWAENQTKQISCSYSSATHIQLAIWIPLMPTQRKCAYL